VLPLLQTEGDRDGIRRGPFRAVALLPSGQRKRLRYGAVQAEIVGRYAFGGIRDEQFGQRGIVDVQRHADWEAGGGGDFQLVETPDADEARERHLYGLRLENGRRRIGRGRTPGDGPRYADGIPPRSAGGNQPPSRADTIRVRVARTHAAETELLGGEQLQTFRQNVKIRLRAADAGHRVLENDNLAQKKRQRVAVVVIVVVVQPRPLAAGQNGAVGTDFRQQNFLGGKSSQQIQGIGIAFVIAGDGSDCAGVDVRQHDFEKFGAVRRIARHFGYGAVVRASTDDEVSIRGELHGVPEVGVAQTRRRRSPTMRSVCVLKPERVLPKQIARRIVVFDVAGSGG